MRHPSIVELEERNARSGGHWFSPDTKRFFASRIMACTFETDDGTVYFVSSEKFRGFRSPDGPRLYTVRMMRPDGSVDTVGEFQAYRSRSGALAAAKRHAEQHGA